MRHFDAPFKRMTERRNRGLVVFPSLGTFDAQRLGPDGFDSSKLWHLIPIQAHGFSRPQFNIIAAFI
jgi:hypothetical protein